jgi:arylsulfatase A-like enzyme
MNQMKPILAVALMSLTAIVSPAKAAETAPSGKRPNIIFLMDDQHRWDALGRLDPTIKTPTLDRLAKEGILFDQAVCQAPMCVPSRHSMMLGLYPHQLGILSNGPGLRDEQLPCDPLPELLRKAGYQTAGFGKTHWLAAGASTRGFEVRYASTDGEKGAILMSKDNPAGLKRYYAEVEPYGDGEEFPAGYLGCTSQVAEEDHRDGWAFKHCLEFLDQGRDEKRPLFLYLSFLKPHAGANVPPGYEDLYDLAAMPVPEQPLLAQVEPCHATGNDRQDMYREFWSKATKAQWQQMVLRYRANCSWMDSMFGRVMDKLQAKGLLENCLIVYVSDHGEMLGERFYRFNKYCLYDASARVPLILSGTAIPAAQRGMVDHRMAEEVDLYPTLAKLAGIPPLPNKPGENLLAPSSRKAGFCEYSDRPDGVAFMWRTRERKLILSFPKQQVQQGSVQLTDVVAGELYDLQTDPKEWQNLYAKDESRAAREQLSRELIAHLNEVALKPMKPSR